VRAIKVSEFGGPEVLALTEVPEPSAGEGQIAVEVSAAGINYADTHQAENTHIALTELPLSPGL